MAPGGIGPARSPGSPARSLGPCAQPPGGLLLTPLTRVQDTPRAVPGVRTLTRARAQQPSIELALILGMRIITVCQTVLSGNLYGQFPDSHSGNQSGLTAFPRGLRKWIQCPGGWNQGPGGFGIRAREAGIIRARVIGFRAREGPHGV